MAERTLKTRILVKYDTFENWSVKNPVLKAGELAVATIATGETQTVNSVETPQALIKVGDGTSNYNDLKFVSGLAADVHSWAKAETKPVYAASEITGLDTYISGQIQDTDTQYKLVKVSDYNYKLQSKAKTDSEWSDVADSVIEIPDKTSDIEALQTLVGNTAVATQIANAITALKLSDTYATKDSLAEVKSTADSAKATLDAFLKDADATENAVDTLKEIQDYITSDGSAAAEVTNKISALEGKAHEHTNKTVLDGITSEKVTAWDGAEQKAKDYADGLASNYATAAQGTKADSALQEIATTENGGLKVTDKNKIDIDDDIVFVFDCGNATI